MGRKCCVPQCFTNYNATNKRDAIKGAVFHFPKDDNLRWCWIRHIQRPEFVPTTASVICEYHFEEKFLTRLPVGRVRLKENAYPTKFPRWGDHYHQQLSTIDDEIPDFYHKNGSNKKKEQPYATIDNPPDFSSITGNDPIFEMAYRTIWMTFNDDNEFDKRYFYEKLTNHIVKNIDLTRFFYKISDKIVVFTVSNEENFSIVWLVEIQKDFTFQIYYKGSPFLISELALKKDDTIPVKILSYAKLEYLFDILQESET